ncbi:uncharacterized protein LOC108252375 [Diaphorina citri]|uniref:Uncharacterized protein LOC108252375 n=1 Tax=Diaphorina citri TaxID=121845 RepID=A0A3Q0ISN0_DIACI|nr:uncharacterized protein LOC108252375 [Diaphorina citri]
MVEKRPKEPYNIELINTLYENVPAFTDIFDEETWYIFCGCFVATTFLVVFLVSRYVTIKPVDW